MTSGKGNIVSVNIREMTDGEQLAEIEKKLEAWGESTAIYFPPPNHLGLRACRWLVARVHALEAQVALDGAVREVAREVVDWYNLVDLVNRVKILKAALAARDAAGKGE